MDVRAGRWGRSWLGAVAVAAGLGSCAGDGAVGVAPTIAELTVSPMEIAAGAVAELRLELRAQDPDADMEELEMRLLREGVVVAHMQAPIAGATGHPTALIRTAMTLSLPVSGTYTLGVRVVDAESNASNELAVPLTVR